MNDRRIVLREYDKLFEFDPRLLDGEFDELEECVWDCWDQYGNEGALTMGRSKKRERFFKPTHYVGLFTLPGGLRIEILPKLLLTEETKDTSEKARLAQEDADRDFFFTMLRTCGVIPWAPSSRGGLDRRHTDMLECFYAAFVEDVQRLVRQGLASGYHTETDNQPFLKGRLELAGHIKYNAAHRERFYVTYDVFDQDRSVARYEEALGWKVKVQESKRFLYNAQKKDWIPLKPDLVLTYGRGKDKRCFVMDTKWKRLNSKDRNGSVAQADLYQMYAYGKIYAADRVTLLYPWSRNGRELTFVSCEKDAVTVDVKQFHVDQIEEELVPYIQKLLEDKNEQS